MTTPTSSIMEPSLPEASTTPLPSNGGANPNRSDPVRPSTAPGYDPTQPQQLYQPYISQSSESQFPTGPMETIPEEVNSVPSYRDFSTPAGTDRSARIIPLAQNGSQAATELPQSPYGIQIDSSRGNSEQSVDGSMGFAVTNAEGSAQASHAVTNPPEQGVTSLPVSSLRTPGFRVVEGLGLSPQPQLIASDVPVDEVPFCSGGTFTRGYYSSTASTRR